MRYFWNLVTGDLVATRDRHTIAILKMEGYIEVSYERYKEIARAR